MDEGAGVIRQGRHMDLEILVFLTIIYANAVRICVYLLQKKRKENPHS